MGLFMVIISPESLRLTAIYGFASGGAILLLGALVGDWIDRTPRLRGTSFYLDIFLALFLFRFVTSHPISFYSILFYVMYSKLVLYSR